MVVPTRAFYDRDAPLTYPRTPPIQPAAGGGYDDPYRPGVAPGPYAPSRAPVVNPPFNKAYGFYEGSFAPQQELESQLSGINRQRLGAKQGYQDQQGGFLQSNYDLGLRGVGVDQAELGSNRAFQQEFQDSLNRGFDIQEAFMRGMHASQGRTFDLRGQNLDAMLGFDVGDIRRQFSRDFRSARSDATARGAMTAPGTEQTFGDLRTQKGEDIRRRKSTYRTETGLLGEERTQEGFGFTKDIGLLGEDRTRSDIDNRKVMRGFDFMEQRYGIQKDKLKLDLDRGLAQLGFDKNLTALDIAEASVSDHHGARQWAQKIMEAAMAAAQSGAFG